MTKTLKTIALAGATAVMAMQATVVAAPTPWTLDTSHSSLGFAVRHMMISKVRGSFRIFSGTVKFNDKGQLLSVQGNVDVKSVDTQNEKRDNHLKADDFFAADKYPTMKFVSTKVTHKGKNVTVLGKLTMRGVTRNITLKGEHLGMTKANFGSGPSQHTGYTLFGKVNRRDYGLNFGGVMNGRAMVGDEVELNLEMEAMRKL